MRTIYILFLYRILKRITSIKSLEEYISTLEGQSLSIEPVLAVKKDEVKADTTEVKVTKKNLKREEDIRSTHTEKTSASEFVSTLDDSIIDKIEVFTDDLNSLLGLVYDLETADVAMSLDIISRMGESIDNICSTLEAMLAFPIIVRAFYALNQFILELTEIELSQEEKKAMFVTIFIGMVDDLEKWLDIIFVQLSTDDIHYLDASFSSNILAIETTFIEEEDDDDDLEFF
ncbi:MAG: hypothetical protein Q9M43_11310 [Sulfurimonas sp.]|nr:hypothetical protein [Sulfurimonas sp.]